jgi:hypothetical protein
MCVIKQIPMGAVFNFAYLITHMIETIFNLAPHFFTYRSCPTDLNSKRKLINVYRPDHHIQHNAGASRNSSKLICWSETLWRYRWLGVCWAGFAGVWGFAGSNLAVRHFQFVCSICWSLRLTVA